MKDILLTEDGDLLVGEGGDIALTDSVRQAVRIRLRWFFDEWRFAPSLGVPYFEEVFVKNPNLEGIRRMIRDEVMRVDEVLDARNITVALDKPTRTAAVAMDITVAEETFRMEVRIDFPAAR